MNESRRKQSLTESLEELEASDPEVARVAKVYDLTVAHLNFQARMARYKDHKAGVCDRETCEYRH